MEQECLPLTNPTLEEVAKQFESWRQKKPRPRAIPSALWQMAVNLFSHYSVSQISRNLGLSYAELKNRILALPGTQFPEHDPHQTFIELDFGQSSPAITSCVVEKEDQHGTKTTMTVKVPEIPNLLELVKAFCSQE